MSEQMEDDVLRKIIESLQTDKLEVRPKFFAIEDCKLGNKGRRW